MSGFTKGPWKLLHSIPEEGVECFWLMAQPGGGICRGFSQEIASINGPQCGEQLANARLIAAAPELYETLESCELWFKQHSPVALLINGPGDAEHPMLTMIRTALSKAAGEGV